jgi:hypothetical protein
VIDILEADLRAVHGKIEGIQQELRTQFTRIAEIQAELDRLLPAPTKPSVSTS